MKNQAEEADKIYSYISREHGGSELKIMSLMIVTALLMIRDVILKTKRESKKNEKMAD